MSARVEEIYDLTCHGCAQLIELPARLVRDAAGHCPSCGATVEIHWRDEVKR